MHAQIKKVDTVHAQDYGTMSVEQLNMNVVKNKKREIKIAEEMQYVQLSRKPNVLIRQVQSLLIDLGMFSN